MLSRNVTDTTDARPQTHDYPRLKTPLLPARPARTTQATPSTSAVEKAESTEPHAPLWTRREDGTWFLEKTQPPASDTSLYPVVAGDSGDVPNPRRTVHILGNDRKARFLAFELQPLYDSVHLFRTAGGRLVDFEFRPGADREPRLRADLEEPREPSATSAEEGQISNLITSGPAVDTVRRMSRLKHRITDQTAVCLMHEGLGVAEELNETVFNEEGDAHPEYVLGHLDPRRLLQESSGHSFDGQTSGAASIHAHPELKTRLVPIDPILSKPPRESPFATGLIDSFRTSPHLNAQLTPFHKWLHIKFQAMIFTAVADPVSVVVGCRYDEITKIKWATSLMMMLLDEIQRVVAALPELHHSPLIRSMVQRETLRKVCFARLRAMKPTPSRMAAAIARGNKVDVDTFNGYFIRRGRQLGIESPHNEMVVAMIKAKHGMRVRELEEQVPFEITSRPHGRLY